MNEGYEDTMAWTVDDEVDICRECPIEAAENPRFQCLAVHVKHPRVHGLELQDLWRLESILTCVYLFINVRFSSSKQGFYHWNSGIERDIRPICHWQIYHLYPRLLRLRKTLVLWCRVGNGSFRSKLDREFSERELLHPFPFPNNTPVAL